MTLPPAKVCACSHPEVDHGRATGPLRALVGSCFVEGCDCTLFTPDERLSWENWDRKQGRARARVRETEEHRRVRETLYEQRGNVTVVPREKR